MELSERLPASEVQVWLLELAAPPAAVEACARTLSAAEQERASRFRLEHLKTSYVLSRGILRVLLGRYLATQPACIQIAHGPRGKPKVAFPATSLEFNLAHSGNYAIYAFASGCAVGVDIEEVRPVPDQEGIVRRFFSPDERDEWLRLGPELRDRAFFHCWTGKEAYIKGRGDGLSIPLDSFRVSLLPAAPGERIHADDSSGTPGWSLYSFTPAAGYAGAIALPERGRSIRLLPPVNAGQLLDLVSRPGSFPSALE
jgi:4'-phosphopantetheinyl transferase